MIYNMLYNLLYNTLYTIEFSFTVIWHHISCFLPCSLVGTCLVPCTNLPDIPEAPELSEASGPEWEERDWEDYNYDAHADISAHSWGKLTRDPFADLLNGLPITAVMLACSSAAQLCEFGKYLLN